MNMGSEWSAAQQRLRSRARQPEREPLLSSQLSSTRRIAHRSPRDYTEQDADAQVECEAQATVGSPKRK